MEFNKHFIGDLHIPVNPVVLCENSLHLVRRNLRLYGNFFKYVIIRLIGVDRIMVTDKRLEQPHLMHAKNFVIALLVI
jgi:hypothetical protein